jgi:exonuclease III
MLKRLANCVSWVDMIRICHNQHGKFSTAFSSRSKGLLDNNGWDEDTAMTNKGETKTPQYNK